MEEVLIDRDEYNNISVDNNENIVSSDIRADIINSELRNGELLFRIRVTYNER